MLFGPFSPNIVTNLIMHFANWNWNNKLSSPEGAWPLNNSSNTTHSWKNNLLNSHKTKQTTPFHCYDQGVIPKSVVWLYRSPRSVNCGPSPTSTKVTMCDIFSTVSPSFHTYWFHGCHAHSPPPPPPPTPSFCVIELVFVSNYKLL